MLEALASCFVCAPLPLYTSTPQSPIAFDPRWQLFHYPGYTIGAAAACAAPLAQPRHLFSLHFSSLSPPSFRITEQHREFRQLALPFQPFSLSAFQPFASSLFSSSLFSFALLGGFGRRLTNTHDQPSTLSALSLSIYPLCMMPLLLSLCGTLCRFLSQNPLHFSAPHTPQRHRHTIAPTSQSRHPSRNLATPLVPPFSHLCTCFAICVASAISLAICVAPLAIHASTPCR